MRRSSRNLGVALLQKSDSTIQSRGNDDPEIEPVFVLGSAKTVGPSGVVFEVKETENNTITGSATVVGEPKLKEDKHHKFKAGTVVFEMASGNGNKVEVVVDAKGKIDAPIHLSADQQVIFRNLAIEARASAQQAQAIQNQKRQPGPPSP